jgi:hypothetical protein
MGANGIFDPKSDILHTFDSIKEAVAYADQHRDKENGSATKGTRKFCETGSFKEAAMLADEGWSAKRTAIDAVLVPLRERLSEMLDWVPERTLDMIGYEPDIDLFLDGELECMVEDMIVEAPKTGKVFTLLLNTTYPGFTDADDVLRRGAAVAGLVEAFQMLDLELEVWVENTVSSRDTNGKFWSMLTKVHNAGENLDVDAIAFPIAHPSWLRRIVFACKEGESAKVRDSFGFYQHGGYGNCIGSVHAKRVDASIMLSLDSRGKYDDDPVQWILEQLETLGVWEQAES